LPTGLAHRKFVVEPGAAASQLAGRGIMSANFLSREISPYLLQHKDNPVHWRPWGPEALAEAQSRNKPILLSVGYAACHWCHVMAHESFEDEDTAALMNRGFVNIKVDREERPDVDAIYQTALALIGEHGGWPLTMFLTPSGEPFWGGTYFPPEPRFGRAAFRDVLARVIEVYRTAPDKVAENAAALKSALQSLSTPRRGAGIAPGLLGQAATVVLRAIDPVFGGIGRAPKFPQPSLLELLWRGFKATGNPALRHAVMLSLERMAMGGIYDHLGGGFARYATDSEWLVPHFEKMLYDNAQLVSLIALVWPDSKDPLLAARAAETVDFVLRDMRAEGGFASSYDADSEGHEGKFYIWSEDEIDRLLGADAEAFKSAYDVTGAGNWEGVNILRRVAAYGADPALEDGLARCRKILWEAREHRVKPGRDDKVLCDWNGLMIQALANAGAVFDRPEWIAAAREAFDFIVAKLSDGPRLRHSYRLGEARHPATLDDYAAMSGAALALFESTGDKDCLAHAEAWAGVADRHFWDAGAGGYFLSADDTKDLITRTKTAMDSAMPSGNGMMALVLARLYHLTGGREYRLRAQALIAAFSGEIPENFHSMPGLLAADDLLANGIEVVILGRRGQEDTGTLLRAVYDRSLPNRVVQVLGPAVELPAGHPAFGRRQLDGQATAYVCRGQTCSLPVTAPAALAALLNTR
jgi:uncharacterized protein YyaL (SSP411 family)